MPSHNSLRDRISIAITEALKPHPSVYAGWEGGSAAFGALDEYSDIDLTCLVADDASFETLHSCAEKALSAISPITVSHSAPPGRYYKLADGGDFLLVDLVFLRAGDPDHFLEVERHGHVRPLFDKGNWLRSRKIDQEALAAKRSTRYRELQTWFVVSQNFVRKEILRGHDVDAIRSFWSYTLRPLAELLRMKYCPVRWDFGTRYLDRDLPPSEYERFRELTLVRDLDDLTSKLATATTWGTILLTELETLPR